MKYVIEKWNFMEIESDTPCVSTINLCQQKFIATSTHIEQRKKLFHRRSIVFNHFRFFIFLKLQLWMAFRNFINDGIYLVSYKYDSFSTTYLNICCIVKAYYLELILNELMFWPKNMEVLYINAWKHSLYQNNNW